jgi:hypothetical protein
MPLQAVSFQDFSHFGKIRQIQPKLEFQFQTRLNLHFFLTKTVIQNGSQKPVMPKNISFLPRRPVSKKGSATNQQDIKTT